MSELRHDPIQRRWVIIATERSSRPSDFHEEPCEPPKAKFCPFCEGNEEKTPPEIFAFRPVPGPPNSKGWKVRVIPNKFPALSTEGSLGRHGVGMYDAMNGVGAHEVIIENPFHNGHFSEMTHEHTVLLLTTYRERLRELMNDQRLRYVLIFKNHKDVAGASLSHPHTQIIGTPVIPQTVGQELFSAKEHFQNKERCLFCDIIREEVERNVRIIYLDEHYIAFTPYASRFPFEVFVAPRRHAHSFADITDEHIENLSYPMRHVLGKLKAALNDPPYNFILHTAPNTNTAVRRSHYWDTLQLDYHWHIEIMPRLTKIAGFEWGTGFYINPTPPEEAAKYLKETALPEGLAP